MASAPLRRLGLLAAGLVLGLLLAGVFLWAYLRAAQVGELESAVAARMNLPSGSLDLEEVDEAGRLRFTIRDLVLLERAGRDTVAIVPSLSLWMNARSMAGQGPIEFTDVVLREPTLRLIQREEGEWNLFQALQAEVEGEPVAPSEEGKPFLFRGITIAGGRATIAIPAEPVDTASFAADLQIPRARIGGRLYQVYQLRDVDATVPELWLGGERGWRARVEGLEASVVEPELRIADLQLRIASEGEEAVRFALERLRVGRSTLAGEGVIRFAEAGAQYDVQIRADPLAFADVRSLLPSLPEEGLARFALDVEPLAGGRTALAFQDLEVSALDARASGRLTMIVGGTAPVAFRDTRLTVESLELATLERLGLVEDLAFRGTVRGTLSTPETANGNGSVAGGLFIDLSASFAPKDQPDAIPSVIAASGGVALGGEDAPLRFDDLRLQLQPLYLSTLRPLATPEQAERLRGAVRGAVTVSGTPRDLRFVEGQLAYAVGDAAPTRLTGLTGRVSLDPSLTFDVRARAEPIALATLTELFPALPFRTATLSGPIRVAGSPERIRLDADLQGAAGAFSVGGTVALGEVPSFDLSGRVRALTPGALVRGELPVEGEVTGTYAVNGTAQDLRFDVNLAQTAGNFALRGRVQNPGPQGMIFDVSGDVSQFRIGALLGRPALFPGPMTGPIAVTGGGGRPYQFDVDLRGDSIGLDLEGSYLAGAVPTYSVRGRVLGLNLAQLPFGTLPRTNLNAHLDVQGRGTTPETFAGTLALSAEGSTVSGIPVRTAVVRAVGREGILDLDTLSLALRDARLDAGGSLGLTRPATEPLTFAFDSPDLGALVRAVGPRQLPPELAGSLTARGSIAGLLRAPEVALTANGRNLRFNQWEAATLAVGAQVRRTETAGWAGQANVQATEMVLAGGERLEELRAEVEGTQQRLDVGLFARRTEGSEIALSGLVELEGTTPRGLTLESLAMRLEGMEWALANPTRVRWGGVDGVLVENLVLEQRGGGSGSIRVDGLLPPTGAADLEVQVRDLDLAILRQLASTAPEMGGVLDLDAVLEGPVGSPDFNLRATIDSLRYQGAEADSVVVGARYAGRSMLVDAGIWQAGRRLLEAEAQIPSVIGLADLLPSFELLREEPVTARLTADSLALALLTAPIPQLAEGAGAISAEATVRGTIARPVFQGFAVMNEGAVRVLPLGVRYEGINGRLSLENQIVRIDSLTARSVGTASLNGTVRFGGGGPNVYLLAQLDDFQAMDVEEVAQVRLTGDVALSGDLPAPVLTGEITVEESTFYIPELGEGSTVELTDIEIGQIGADTVTTPAMGPAWLAGLRVSQLTVNVGESVWLQSDDARIQIAGEDLIVTRNGEDLRVFGILRAERGNYNLRVGPLTRQFEIVRGQVRFFGTEDFNPDLDIVASNEIRTIQSGSATPITVIVNITGTVQFPRIQLTSDTRPPLPESEILSLLIFGRPSFELGGAAGALAQEVILQEALGGVLFAPLEQLFLRSGLVEYVQFRSVQNQVGGIGQSLGMTTVEVGSEIADNVFLTLECGIGVILGTSGLDCGTRVDVELRRNFTASGAYGPVRRDRILQFLAAEGLQYQWSVELRRRWEFGISDAPSMLDVAPPRPEGDVIAPTPIVPPPPVPPPVKK